MLPERLLLKKRNHGAAAIDELADIEIEYAFIERIVEFGDQTALDHAAGIVDEDVDAAQAFLRLCNEYSRRLAFKKVQLACLDPLAARVRLLRLRHPGIGRRPWLPPSPKRGLPPRRCPSPHR